jgi:hypothetical protein
MSSDQGILLKGVNSAPIVPDSTHGLIYVQNNTPKQLHYVNDNGTNFNLFSANRGATVASTGNVSLASTLDGVTIDSVTLVTGNVVLLKDQTSSVENGLYLVNTSPALATRTEPMFVGQNAQGVIIYVNSGTINGGYNWTCTNVPGLAVVGTDSLTFSITSAMKSYITAVTSTFYAPQNGMYIFKVSGGGGGGAAGHLNTPAYAGGGGGASGDYIELKFEMTSGQTIDFSIGAGGAGGVTSLAGTTGNPTTLTYSGTGKVYSISGGNGGKLATMIGAGGDGANGYYAGGGGSGDDNSGLNNGVSTFSPYFDAATIGFYGGDGGFFGGTAGIADFNDAAGGGGGGPFGGNGGGGTTDGSGNFDNGIGYPGLYGCGGGGGAADSLVFWDGGAGGTGFLLIVF